MYGSIFNMSVKSGHKQELLESLNREMPKGMLAWFVMQPDDDNSDLVGVAIFDDKDAYVANANSPEQHEAFSEAMTHLTCEPTWNDGEFILGRCCPC